MKPRLSFGVKLLVSYLVLVLTPVAATGLFAYHSLYDSLRERTAENVGWTLQQIRDNIRYRVDEVKQVSDSIFFNQTLQRGFRSYKHGWSDFELSRRYMIPTFQDALLSSRGTIVIRAYFANPLLPEIYDMPQEEDVDPVAGASRFEWLHLARIENRAWYGELPWSVDGEVPLSVYKGDDVVWRQVEGDEKFGHISIIRLLVDFDRQEAIGLLRIIVPLSYLLEAAEGEAAGALDRLMILDGGGRPVIDTADPDAAGEHKPFLRLEESIPGLGWTMAAEVPHGYIKPDADRLRNATLIVLTASTLVLSAIAWLVSRYFSRRVGKLLASLHAVRQGDFRKRITYRGRDEFAEIADAFNRMSEEIDTLIRKVYLANLQMKEAELASLQNQINPHFLYNTLSSIGKLAQFGEIDNVQRMLLELARFYRLSLSDGRSMIAVQHELEQVQAYTEIQKIKYRDKIRVWFDVDTDVYGYTTLKLILQPFVENALEHAFCQRTINIRICARKQGDRIVFTVIDDGMGMRPDTVTAIWNGRVGYGIRNVHERIRLQYGADYGVELFSRLGIGTVARITVPAVRERAAASEAAAGEAPSA